MIHLQIETCKLQIDSQSVYIMVLTYISSSLKLKRASGRCVIIVLLIITRSSLIHSSYSSLGNFLSQFALRTTSNRGEKSAFTIAITKRRSVNLARSSIFDSIPVSKCRARASILTLQFPQRIETAVVLIPIIGTSYKKRTNPASNAVRLA